MKRLTVLCYSGEAPYLDMPQEWLDETVQEIVGKIRNLWNDTYDESNSHKDAAVYKDALTLPCNAVDVLLQLQNDSPIFIGGVSSKSGMSTLEQRGFAAYVNYKTEDGYCAITEQGNSAVAALAFALHKAGKPAVAGLDLPKYLM